MVIKIETRRQFCIKVPIQEAEALEKMARKNNITITEQVRRYIKKGMTVDAYQEDEEQILANMRSSLKTVLDPQIDRMVKITVKNSISSSVNLLYTSMLLYRMCKPDARQRLEQFMEDARVMGIRFVQLGKGSVDDFLKRSMATLNAMWEDGR